MYGPPDSSYNDVKVLSSVAEVQCQVDNFKNLSVPGVGEV